MSKSAAFMLRILIPLTCLLASLFRYNLVSLLYLLSFLFLMILPVPPQVFGRDPYRLWVTEFLLIVCTTTLVFQFIFQIVMLFDGPYGSHLTPGTGLEVLLRLLGLGRLDQGVWRGVQLLLPDVGMGIVCVCTKLVVKQAFEGVWRRKRREEGEEEGGGLKGGYGRSYGAIPVLQGDGGEEEEEGMEEEERRRMLRRGGGYQYGEAAGRVSPQGREMDNSATASLESSFNVGSGSGRYCGGDGGHEPDEDEDVYEDEMDGEVGGDGEGEDSGRPLLQSDGEARNGKGGLKKRKKKQTTNPMGWRGDGGEGTSSLSRGGNGGNYGGVMYGEGSSSSSSFSSPVSSSFAPASYNYDSWMVCSKRHYIASTPLLYGFALFLAGVAMPSILSGLYFLWLLVLIGLWSMNIRLSRKASQIWNGILMYAILHFVVLYLYQFDFMQMLIPSTNNYSEALGLIAFVNHTDPHFDGSFNSDIPWFSYFYVFGVVLLIVSLSVEWRESILSENWTFLTYIGAVLNPILPTVSAEGAGVTDGLLSSPSTATSGDSGVHIRNLRRTSSDLLLSKNGIAIRVYDWFMMQNYMVCNVLMTGWGIAFHSWLAMVILLWSFYGYLSAREKVLRTMPYLVVYVAVVTAIDYAWQINGIAINDYIHVGFYRDSKPGVVMSIKMLLVSFFGFTCRHRFRQGLEDSEGGRRISSVGPGRSHRRDYTPLREEEHFHHVDIIPDSPDSPFIDQEGDEHHTDLSEDESNQKSSHRRSRVLSISLDRAIEKWKAIWSVTLSVTVHSSYLLALLALYFCSLRDVNFFNAAYFAIFIVFWIFPKTASNNWIVLLMYCQSVIVLIYIWSFPFCRSLFYFLKPYAGLIGLESKKETTLQLFLVWHLVILGCSVVQFHTYKVLSRRGDLRGAVEHMYYMDTHESEHSKLSFPRLVLVVFNDHWLMWSYAALLFVGLSGNVSLFKLLYIATLFVCLMCTHVFKNSKTIVRRIFNVFVVYSGAVLGAMYIIQFDEIYKYVLKHMTVADLSDIGLDKRDTSDLFKYLFGPTLVLFAAVVQTRLFSKTEDSSTYGLPLEEAIMRGRTDNWLAQLISFVKRVLIIHTRKLLQLSVFVVIASETSLTSLITALALVVYMPHHLISYSIGLFMLVWFEFVTMCKLIFQLNIVTLSPKGIFSEENMRFLGFAKVDDPGSYVQWLIFSTLLLILQEMTRQWDKEKQITATGIYNPLNSIRLFIVPENDYSSWVWKIKEILNTFFDDFGFELCCFVVCITSFVRLDAYGLVYFVVMGLFVSTRDTNRRRLWNAFVYVIGFFFFVQYVSLLQFPGDYVHYPWMSWDPILQKIVQKWLYFPPGQNESAVVADFFLYFFSCLLGHSYMKKAINSPKKPKLIDFTAVRPRTSVIAFKLFFFRNFYWFVLIVVFLAGCNKSDLISFGYILWCFDLLRKGELLMLDKELRTTRWRLLRGYNYYVLLARLVYQLPAVVVDWNRVPSTVVHFLDIVGLGRGLYINVPRSGAIQAWSIEGIVIELICFLLIMIQQRIFSSREIMFVIEYTRRDHAKAFMRAEKFANYIREKLEEQQLEEHNHKENIRMRIEFLKKNSGGDKKSHMLFKSSEDLYGERVTTVPEDNAGLGLGLEESCALKNDALRVSYEETENLLGATSDLKGKTPLRNIRKLAQSPTGSTGGDFVDMEESIENEAPEVRSKFTLQLVQLIDSMLQTLYNLSEEYRFFGEDDDVIAELEAENARRVNPQLSEQVIRPRLEKLWRSLKFAAYAQSSWICFIIMFLNCLVNANLLAVVYPVAMFTIVMPYRPNPPYALWISLIVYTEIVICVKYLFQFSFWEFNDVDDNLSWVVLVGIEKHSGHSFMAYVTWDLWVLLSLFFHRWMMQRLGMWYHVGSSHETRLQGRKSFSSGKSMDESGSYNQPVAGYIPANTSTGSLSGTTKLKRKRSSSFGSSYIDVFKKNLAISDGGSTSIIHRIADTSYMLAVDRYTAMFLFDMLVFMVTILGWSGFTPRGQFQSDDVFHFLHNNKIPLAFLGILLVQFFLIVCDRIIYLNHSLLMKILFQFTQVIFVHAWIFFILPIYREASFKNNRVAIVWYMLKTMYFTMSALQIRTGYPRRILTNFLTKNYNSVTKVLFMAYRAIPFLYEIRIILDWTCTNTTLSMYEWFKLEDVYATLFIAKSDQETMRKYPRELGQKVSFLIKFAAGGLSLVGLFFLIWFPLIIMSLGSFNTVPVPLQSFSISLSLNGELFGASADQSAGLLPLTPTEVAYVKSSLKDVEAFSTMANSDFKRVLVQPFSRNTWDISPPSRDQLIEGLLNGNNSMEFVLKYAAVRRSNNPLLSEDLSGESVVSMKPSDQRRKVLAEMLRDPDAKRQRSISLDKLTAKILHIPSSGPITMVGSDWKNGTCRLFLSHDENNSNKVTEWWNLPQSDPVYIFPMDAKMKEDGWTEFILMNDRVPQGSLSTITSFGVVGLYVSVVLVVGRFVRLSLTNLYMRIMYEDLPNCDSVLRLCNDIYLVRENGDLAVEETLYKELVSLYRSPETLIEWTKRKKED
eukprot:Nk52_evm48s153 gene=Nk52_evmTU48s153